MQIYTHELQSDEVLQSNSSISNNRFLLPVTFLDIDLRDTTYLI